MQKIESRVAYLAYLEGMAKSNRNAWELQSRRTGTDASRRAKLDATLRFFNQEHQLDALDERLRNEPRSSGLSPALREVVEQIAVDLEDYIRPEHVAAFRRTTVGLLPLSGVDAFCVNRTMFKEPLDGYLVIMNEGLFLCLQLLSKAFLLENLGGDLAQFHSSGAPLHQAAVQHFLSPTSTAAGLVMFDTVPPELEGALAAAQMNMVVVLAQFVLLHEHGHIANDDFELMGEYQFHLASAPESRPEKTEAHWAAEFAADEYALAAICANVGNDASRWANFVAVLVFFNMLQAAEDLQGEPLCPLHPPPQARAERLMSLMGKNFPPDEQMRNQIQAAQHILAGWTGRGRAGDGS